MIKDSGRALKLEYNVLNLVSDVQDPDGWSRTKYFYTADGTKTGAKGRNGQLYYLGSLRYTKMFSDNRLQLDFAQFSDGIIRESGETNYFFKDHLGSVRTVVDGSGNILEQSDYYPFGGRHKRDDYAFSDNNYRFNGKEEQSNYLGMPELGWTDFGARMYDTRLGRWFTQDPLCQFASPYNFCGNNPLNYIDPLGLWSNNSSGGYYTNDQNDIERFFNYMSSASYYSSSSMSTMTNFLDSEMSSNRGAIYSDKTLGSNFILESAKVVGSPGNWKADENSWNRIRGMVDDYQNGLNGSAYNQRFFNPVISGIYGAQSGFMWGTAEVGSYSLQKVGTYFSTAGYALTATGIGAEVGVPLIAIGNTMQKTGFVIETGIDFAKGNNYKAAYSLTTGIPMQLIGSASKYLPAYQGAIFNLILTPVNKTLDYGKSKLEK